jgi:hypothetical protein
MSLTLQNIWRSSLELANTRADQTETSQNRWAIEKGEIVPLKRNERFRKMTRFFACMNSRSP